MKCLRSPIAARNIFHPACHYCLPTRLTKKSTNANKTRRINFCTSPPRVSVSYKMYKMPTKRHRGAEYSNRRSPVDVAPARARARVSGRALCAEKAPSRTAVATVRKRTARVRRARRHRVGARERRRRRRRRTATRWATRRATRAVERSCGARATRRGRRRRETTRRLTFATAREARRSRRERARRARRDGGTDDEARARAATNADGGDSFAR